jgi:L-threonylcarbamoyladenylate synthase
MGKVAIPRSKSESLARHRLEPTLRALRGGGVIAYPTEAVFGIGCEPLNPEAVRRVLRLKARSWTKGLILVAADFWQLEPYLAPVPPALAERALGTWPGAVTWLWPATPRVPVWVRGCHRQVAVRISAHPLVRALCLAYGGALISTSANHAGAPPARDALSARARFGAGLDALLPGTVGGALRPSEIRDLCSAQVMRPA